MKLFKAVVAYLIAVCILSTAAFLFAFTYGTLCTWHCGYEHRKQVEAVYRVHDLYCARTHSKYCYLNKRI